MNPYFLYLVFACVLLVATGARSDGTLKRASAKAHASADSTPNKPSAAMQAGVAEASLIEVYRLIGQGQSRDALTKAEALTRKFPSFQLAQLVYGDLLAARTRPVNALGDVPAAMLKVGSSTLGELRDESQMRLKALKERPPAGAIPSQFLSLSQRTKHAIAVDTSRSRLYLFENGPTGLTLVADYYLSVGKSGWEKAVEGDLRTPLGIYFITSNLNPKSLKDFYGSGALPINYPNMLDAKRGKTGSGIWLHGTPPGQFSRPPLATDGCLVLSNPDLEKIIQTVAIRTTPVVISQKLNWVAPHSARTEGKQFESALSAWQSAKSSGNVERVLDFYSQDFNSNGKSLKQWAPALRGEMSKVVGRPIELKDLSFMRWTDTADTMVVTFGEVADGARTGPTKRQYWVRQGAQWKIFFEGVIG